MYSTLDLEHPVHRFLVLAHIRNKFRTAWKRTLNPQLLAGYAPSLPGVLRLIASVSRKSSYLVVGVGLCSFATYCDLLLRERHLDGWKHWTESAIRQANFLFYPSAMRSWYRPFTQSSTPTICISTQTRTGLIYSCGSGLELKATSRLRHRRQVVDAGTSNDNCMRKQTGPILSGTYTRNTNERCEGEWREFLYLTKMGSRTRVNLRDSFSRTKIPRPIRSRASREGNTSRYVVIFHGWWNDSG